jgi:Coenzyme PQQ synthesis protein D (PqqD)
MSRLFEVESHVRSMIDEDGAVLLDLQAGKYYSLNGIAAQIWLKTVAGEEGSTITQTICEAYGVQEDRVKFDIQTLITGLTGKGLIRANS